MVKTGSAWVAWKDVEKLWPHEIYVNGEHAEGMWRSVAGKERCREKVRDGRMKKSVAVVT